MPKNRSKFIVYIALAVGVMIVAPYIWDGLINNGHYPIDWEAWWAFCTFLIAVTAGAVAWGEYLLHSEMSKPKLRVDIRARQIERRIGNWDRYSILKEVRVVNVGGGAAIQIKVDADPEIHLSDDEEEVDAYFKSIDISTLIPYENQTFFYFDDPTGLGKPSTATFDNEGKTTIALSWEDSLGNSYSTKREIDLGTHTTAQLI